jgi:hypothetical protein
MLVFSAAVFTVVVGTGAGLALWMVSLSCMVFGMWHLLEQRYIACAKHLAMFILLFAFGGVLLTEAQLLSLSLI